MAVDIGGTFTDVVLENEGGQDQLKVLTTPDAPERAALRTREHRGKRRAGAANKASPK